MSEHLGLVAVVMGSQSDWETMQHCVSLLKELNISHHAQIVSAHRTPDLLFEFSQTAHEKGFEIIIAGAGGAAHLPGMLAAKTRLPIIGVPIKSTHLNGLDSLLSIVQMPAGVPVATVAIGEAGAKNAALLAAGILANYHPNIAKTLEAFRKAQTDKILQNQHIST